MRNPSFDVLIAGAGPAGSALGLRLARSGCSVALLEASDYSRFRAGESLPPTVGLRIDQLHLAESFEAVRSAPVHGVASAWGSADLTTSSFVNNPYIHGWHVDRNVFDAMVNRAAEEAGASVFRHTRAHTIEVGTHRRWIVSARSNLGEQRFTAGFLVDATGRSARLATKLGGRRQRLDTLVAVCVVYSTCRAQDTSTPQDTSIHHGKSPERLHWSTAQQGALPSLVESHPLGWWYSGGLPSGEVVVMFYTDSDICAQRGLARPAIWDRFLSESRHTRERLANRRRIGDVARVFSVSSHLLEPAAGAGWLAVGDAVMGRDPLSSSGVDFALASAARAFTALQDLAAGDRESLASYRSAMAQDFSTYVAQRGAYYGMERQWPDAPFWQRRSMPQLGHRRRA